MSELKFWFLTSDDIEDTAASKQCSCWCRIQKHLFSISVMSSMAVDGISSNSGVKNCSVIGLAHSFVVSGVEFFNKKKVTTGFILRKDASVALSLWDMKD